MSDVGDENPDLSIIRGAGAVVERLQYLGALHAQKRRVVDSVVSGFGHKLQAKAAKTREHEAKQEVEDSYHDLEIAATIGKQLMQENMELKDEVQRLEGMEESFSSQEALQHQHRRLRMQAQEVKDENIRLSSLAAELEEALREAQQCSDRRALDESINQQRQAESINQLEGSVNQLRARLCQTEAALCHAEAGLCQSDGARKAAQEEGREGEAARAVRRARAETAKLRWRLAAAGAAKAKAKAKAAVPSPPPPPNAAAAAAAAAEEQAEVQQAEEQRAEQEAAVAGLHEELASVCAELATAQVG
jgi:hypothetical protein